MTTLSFVDALARPRGWVELAHDGNVVRASDAFTFMQRMGYSTAVVRGYALMYNLDIVETK